MNNNKDDFRNLKFLNLEKNKLNNISKELLNALSNLEYLFLSHNYIISLKSFSGMNLTNLNYLSLSYNNIYDFSPLSEADLSNLNVLNLSSNKIQNISCLEKMKLSFLEELKLNDNEIYDINILGTAKIPELKILDLKNNKIKSILIIESSKFPKLEILDLKNNDINNINPLKNVSFKETLKELDLSNNLINQFELLNLIYFPSLIKVSMFPLKDLKDNDAFNNQLKILSIKLRLYGYEMNQINKNDSISILISPFNVINNSEIYDNKSFDYTNSFKIVTNPNKNMQEIIYFFFKKILEMNDYEINQNQNYIIFGKMNSKWDTVGNNTEINNYSILYYNDDNEIIKNKNKTNNLYLIKEYKKKFQRNNYSKIPYYINSITKLSSPENICPFKIQIKNKITNDNQIIVDDKESFSSFLKKNNIYDKLPIIFINSDYYKGFLHFLKQSRKYENFKNKKEITKLLIESNEKNKNNHLKDKHIIADVVENSNFYSLNDAIEIIKNIKSEIQGNYKQIINNWISLFLKF